MKLIKKISKHKYTFILKPKFNNNNKTENFQFSIITQLIKFRQKTTKKMAHAI